MRHLVALLLLAISLALPAPSPAQTAAPALAGEWEGVVRTPRPSVIKLTLAPSANGWTGTITLPARGIEALALDSLAVKGDSLAARPGGRYRSALLRGRIADGGRLLEGTMLLGPATMPVRLARPGSERAAAFAREAAAPFDVSHQHPDSARIVADDIERFWAAYDASTPADRAAVLRSAYLDRGSPGLQDFVVLRIGSAENLAKAVDEHPRYYESARASMLRLREYEPQIRQAFHRLEEIYPEAVYPDVYFVVGLLSTGGTTSGRGLLIGAEMHGRTEAMPQDELADWLKAVLKPAEAVPHIVAHELVHYQQDNAGGNSLLRAALVEGVPDLVAELISGRHINQAAQAYGDAHEAELWCEFRGQMHGSDTSNWLYNGNRSKDRPGDLGYWMGYRIARAYYEKAADKKQAVRDMLKIRDFDAFLAASGYADRFTCPQPTTTRTP